MKTRLNFLTIIALALPLGLSALSSAPAQTNGESNPVRQRLAGVVVRSPTGATTLEKPEPAKESEHLQFLTDEEVLASFPKGSCILAEIDGQKELVFLDANLGRTYMARSH
jgi:hypothetical protein